MSKTASESLRVTRLPQLFAATTIGVALLALIGWLAEIRFLAGQWGTFIPVAPSTALAFLLLSGAMFIYARLPAQRASRLFALAAVSSVSLLSVLVLAQFISGIDLGVEQALSRTNELLGSTPLGRMSPLTAIAFLFESAAFFVLLIAPRRRNAPTAAALLAAGATAINLVVLIGYAYGAPLLYGGPVVPTALPTAVAFVLLGVGQIGLAAPGMPALRAWSGASMRGILLRAFLPFMLFFILFEGWVEATLQPILTPNRALWQSLMALTAGVLIVVIIGWSARRTGDTIEQAQEMVRESEERFHAVLNSAPITIFATDNKGVFTLHEGRGMQRVGMKPGENVGMSAFDLYRSLPVIEPTGKVTTGEDVIHRVLGGETVVGITELKDVCFDNQITPLLDAQGQVVGLVGVATDVTERKRAEEALRESEALYRTLFDDTPIGLGIADRAGNLRFFNDAILQPGGYTRDDISRIGNVANLYYTPEQRTEVLAVARQHGIVHQHPVQFKRKDGTYYDALLSMVPVQIKGEPCWQAMVEDITERKRAEEEIRRRADEFAALYEITRDLTLQLDRSFLLQTITERAIALLGADSSLIYLYDPAADEIELAVANGLNMPLGTRLTMGEGVSGRVAKTRAPLRVDHYQEWDQQSPKYRGLPIAAVLAVPMLYGGQLIGVLGVSKSEKTMRRFSEEDERLLTLFAVQAASAVHGARLLDETRARAEQLALLYDAGLTLNRTLEPRAQLELLCTIAMKALRADNTTFFRYDAARNDLGLEFGVGLVQELDLLRDARFPLGAERGLIGWVAQKRAPLCLSDVTADPRWIATDPAIRSALWVPVLHDEQLLGVLSASSTRVNAFTPQDERLFVLFANQVAVAMENARLFVETHQRLAELEAVNRISTALRAATTLDEMLPRLLDETLAMLDAPAGAISLYDPRREELEQVIARGWFTQTPQTASADDGIAGRVLATGQPYVAREFKPDPSTSELARAQIPNAWGGALVPIRAAHEIIGTLAVSVLLPRELTSSEVHLLTTLAEIAGNAIHRTRLHAQTEMWLQQLQALHAIDIAITGSTDLNVTLNFLLSQVAVQLRVDAASILLLNPLTQTLEYAAGHGFRTRGIEQSRLRLGEGYVGKAALERRMTHAPDLQDAGAGFARAKLLSDEGFVGYYAVPLISKGQVKGVLDVFHRAPLEAEPEWLDFLQALATQAAIAIDSAQLFTALQRSNAELALAYDATIEGWSHALDLRDKETEGHTQRVTETTLRLATAMGIDEEDLGHVRRGALLHDIGKMGIPDAILLKPGPLTDAEWETMRKHPTHAYELMSPINYLQLALDIPYCHHEKWDGSGYPRGLKGEQIPLAARIFAIVDVWDALTSDRPYRAAWSREKTLEHIRALAGTHFDPKVVETFLRVIAGE